MASLPSPTQVAGDQAGVFEAWYRKVDPTGVGTIQAGPAAGFLKKSGLNDNILSKIWDLSDPGGKGYLDKAGFFVALKMVALVQNGKEPNIPNVNLPTPPPNMGEPPPHPPPPHPGPPHPAPPHPGPPHPPPPHKGPPHPGPPHPAPPSKTPVPAHPAPAVSSGVWTITPSDRQRYDQIFNSLGPEANKLHGNKVKGVMLNSKLPMEILGKIWDLADMDKDGNLDRVEFSIAMHLVYKVLENNPMPPSIPQEMLSSAQRAGVAQGPVPAPLAPPAQLQAVNAAKQPPTKRVPSSDALVAAAGCRQVTPVKITGYKPSKFPLSDSESVGNAVWAAELDSTISDIFGTGVEDNDLTATEKPSGPPPAPWVISAAEKARYDVMFHNADIDKDGFVSGQEIKGVFLQSGLPQMVLAHIWNLCDIKQTGKLTSEQFALAMWLIQQKLTGTDPPAALTPEMIPPTMRPKPSAESAMDLLGDLMAQAVEVVPAKPQYTNPELQLVADEIDTLNTDKMKLEAEIQQKEASIRVKNNELQNLQTELDTLSSTLRQLEHQKGAAQQRLDDLGNQKKKLDEERSDLDSMIEAEQEEVAKLRTQVEEQETSLKAQEDEVMSKRQELTNLKNQENQLEESVSSMKKRIDQLGITQQETQLHISQARIKITELQESERHMTEVLIAYDSAISSGDASSLSESSLRDVTPTFSDPSYLHIGSPTTSPKEETVAEPVPPQENGLPSQDVSNNPKAKDTSFVGGHDPFASAFGNQQNNVDMFGSWDQNPANAPSNPHPPADPFGGDAFASQTKGANDPFGGESFSGGGGGGGPPPRPESPTPALPPKKSKPPPRPAPPKTRPAKPPPPQLNSNNNPAKSLNTNANTNTNPSAGDPFTGGWGDNKTANTNNGGFADFANFADFDTKCLKVATSNTAASPWGDEDNNNFTTTSKDPFGSPFSAAAALAASAATDPTRSADNSPWPQDSFTSDGFGDSSVFAEDDPFGGASGTSDPFGGDYDPFKDQGFKDEDKFSWDDEPDPFNLPDNYTPSASATDNSSSNNDNYFNKKNDPFAFSSSDNLNANIFPGQATKDNDFGTSYGDIMNKNKGNSRSKSVIGDPFASQVKENAVPVRSKTALGEPGGVDFDLDPFSSNLGVTDPFVKSPSNEDLLNDNFKDWGMNKANRASPFKSNLSSEPHSKNIIESSQGVSEDEQLAWAAQESLRLEDARKQQEDQERAELEAALAISRSIAHSPGKNQSSRSPSTGL